MAYYDLVNILNNLSHSEKIKCDKALGFYCVYLGVTPVKFFFVLELLLGLGFVILTSLFSLFYFTGECYWVLTEDETNYL